MISWDLREERLRAVFLEAISTERRLMRLENAVKSMEDGFGHRLKRLEEEEDARTVAIWKAMRAALLATAGLLADLYLNGGALLKAFIGG